ncbi:PPC domain-containing protein [Longimicrobium sp.]|uniref:PPC domain-containing protein n=1 Tax=Longimicrobium sp. TaxID=2029185 RepID=UPI003B3AFBD1
MNQLHRAALAACLLSALPLSLHAQPGTEPIQVGQSVNGSLSAGDPHVFGRGAFRAYRFQGTAGQRVVATLNSTDFDTYLIVGRVVGPLMDELKSDDDSGDETNSRLRVTLPEDGTYLVVAQSFSEDGAGAFSLGLQAAPEPTTGQARPITLGTPVTGELTETDLTLEDGGRIYDVWTFRGRAGQRVSVQMGSGEFDTYLDLGRMENGQFTSLNTDDDSGEEGTDSRLSQLLPGDGEYVIRASSFGDQGGAYTLSVEERVMRAPANARPLQPGQQVTSQLDEDDAVLEADGSFYELWSYGGRAGEQLRIRMDSEAFDTYVAIGRTDGGEFDEMATMDDGGDGTNTLLEITLPEDGEYVIRANSFSAEQTGDYTLVVESTRDP